MAPINGIQDPGEIRPPNQAVTPPADNPGGSSFEDTMAVTLGDGSRVQNEMDATISAFLRHDSSVKIHEVMATSAEAALSLQLLVEMRNRLTEAYRALMSVQI